MYRASRLGSVVGRSANCGSRPQRPSSDLNRRDGTASGGGGHLARGGENGLTSTLTKYSEARLDSRGRLSLHGLRLLGRW